MLGQLIAETDALTIVDMEASVEHMGRGTVRYADVLLILAEPYYRSLETVGRTAPLARDLGIARVVIVANKVRTPRDEEAIRRYCAERDLDVLAVLPFDDAVLEADQTGMPVLDRAPDSRYVQVVGALQQRLRPHAAGAVAPAEGIDRPATG
jgi:CO dehydrogenase maturation factor